MDFLFTNEKIGYCHHHALEVARCNAPVPKQIVYNDDQEDFYGSPIIHEQRFKELLRETSGILKSYGDDTIDEENISTNYVEHFQNWLCLMHEALYNNSEKGAVFECVCDIIYGIIEINDKYIKLININIRPCAQGMGLYNIVICQILMDCQKTEKGLIIFSPYPYTVDATRSILGNAGMRILEDDNILVSKEDVARLVDLRKICRVEEHRTLNFDIIFLLIVNKDYYPSADQMNSQQEVDARFDRAIQERLGNSCRKKALASDPITPPPPSETGYRLRNFSLTPHPTLPSRKRIYFSSPERQPINTKK